MRVVAIHQPNYLPGLRLFDKLSHADILVWLDSVQFSKNNWTNRNRIRTSSGSQWLTVPVVTSGHFQQRIDEVRPAETEWKRKHLKSLQAAYGRAPFGELVLQIVEASYSNPELRYLADLNMDLTGSISKVLKIATPTIRSRDLGLSETLSASELLLEICRRTNADAYLSGTGGHKYLDSALFERSRVRVGFQRYVHPVYPQRFGGFIANLSVVDLLANVGQDSRSVLDAGAAIEWT